MIHAYDHLRFEVDWDGEPSAPVSPLADTSPSTSTSTTRSPLDILSSVALRHAACAEIRASSLSGECRFMREFFTRGQWKLTQQHQECVRRRATLSVMGRQSCKDDKQAAKAVNEVWDSCFADTRPFDEIYR